MTYDNTAGVGGLIDPTSGSKRKKVVNLLEFESVHKLSAGCKLEQFSVINVQKCSQNGTDDYKLSGVHLNSTRPLRLPAKDDGVNYSNFTTESLLPQPRKPTEVTMRNYRLGSTSVYNGNHQTTSNNMGATLIYKSEAEGEGASRKRSVIIEQLWAQQKQETPSHPIAENSIQNKSVDPNLYNMTTMQDL